MVMAHNQCHWKLKINFGHFNLHVVINHIISSVRSSYSHPDLLLIHHHPPFQITPVLDTGLSLSEPLQLYKGYNAI